MHEKVRAAVPCLKRELAASNSERYKIVRKEVMFVYELMNLLKDGVELYARHLRRDKWQKRAVQKAKEKLHQDPSRAVVIVDHKMRTDP